MRYDYDVNGSSAQMVVLSRNSANETWFMHAIVMADGNVSRTLLYYLIRCNKCAFWNLISEYIRLYKILELYTMAMFLIEH